MKNKIFGVLIALVLAVTGFGLVGCGGGSNPAPGPGPEPAPEVSYDDDTTPVAIDETGLLFECIPYDDVNVENIEYYNLQEGEGIAFVWSVTQEVTDLVIPAYVTDGEEVYKVVEIQNLLFAIDNVDDINYTMYNELVSNIKTITIPSTVVWVDGGAFADSYTDDETNEDVSVFMENLEQIILNNRETLLSINLWSYVDFIAAKSLDMTVNEYCDAEWTEELANAQYNAMVEICNYDEAEDLFYLGNPGNPYMLLVYAGVTYYPYEELGEDEELVANVNENCKVIGQEAFNSSAVTKVILPNGLVTIGDYAFYFCEKLENIIIPDTVTSIGQYSFNSCISASVLYVSEQITDINSDINFWDYFEHGFDKIYINNAELYDFETHFYTCLKYGATLYILKDVYDNNEDILSDQYGTFARIDEDEEYNGKLYAAFGYYPPQE